MLKITSLFFAFWFLFFGSPNQPISSKLNQAQLVMCHTEPQEMADFSQDPAFQQAHFIPEDIDFTPKGKQIKLKVAGGPKGNAYFLKAKGKSKNWLFVYQEWWGLNDHIKKEAEKYFDAFNGTVNVLAVDLYDGKMTDDRTVAAQLMQGVQESRLESLVKAAQHYAGPKARIGSVGWCFGGGWSLKSALITGQQNVGCVIYYGMPVREVEKLKTLNSDVLGIFATETWISKEIVEEFAAKMKEAEKGLTYKIFPGVHGFANPSNPKYEPEATAEAFNMSFNYLNDRYNKK